MNLRSLLRYITPHRRVLATVLLLLLVGSATALVQPWLAGQLTAELLQTENGEPAIQGWLLLWLLLIVLRGTIGFATQYTIGSTGEQLTAQLRSRLFQHMQGLPLHDLQQRKSGEVLALLSNDTEQIANFVTNTVVQLLPLLLTFCGALAMMTLLDPHIAALSLLLVPAALLLVKLPGRQLRPLARDWMQAYSDLLAYLNETLAMMPAIKPFLREPLEQERFDAHNRRVESLARRRLLVQSLLAPAVGVLAGLGVLLLVWAGSARIASGQLDAAALVSLLLYAFMLIQPLRGFANLYGSIQVARGAADRIMDFLAGAREPDDSGRPALPTARGSIRFENVHFHYPGGQPVLRGLNLAVEAGETLAIAGPNGAGKTTLAYLMLRLADPQAGRILIDGTDIRDITLHSLRRQVGLVAQHTLLLNGSVADNIAYGKPDARPEEIARAARAAHAHEFIAQLPRGYDTMIGEQGLRLSGGQRQRIALARSLLLDPPILILDEANSMFDSEAEERFVAECRQTLRDKTLLLITHRPGSLASADRVVQLRDGVCETAGTSLRTGGAGR